MKKKYLFGNISHIFIIKYVLKEMLIVCNEAIRVTYDIFFFEEPPLLLITALMRLDDNISIQSHYLNFNFYCLKWKDNVITFKIISNFKVNI